jgi:uncharacterized membrane protein
MIEAMFAPVMIVVILLVLVAAAIILQLRRGRPSRRDQLAEELRARYALGEMSRNDFDRRRHDLQRRGPAEPPPPDEERRVS